MTSDSATRSFTQLLLWVGLGLFVLAYGLSQYGQAQDRLDHALAIAAIVGGTLAVVGGLLELRKPAA